MIVPIGVARIVRDDKVVIADGIDQNALRNIPTYRYQENTPIQSEYEEKVLANFRDKDQTGSTTTDDDFYSSEHFNEDRFYGRERK